MGGVVGGLIGGVVQGRAAGKAADAQERAAEANIAFQTESRDLITERVDPFYNSGQNALAALNFELFGGERPVFGANTPTVEAFQQANPAYAQAEAERQRNFANADGSDKDQYRSFRPDNRSAAPQYLDRFRVGDSVFDSRADADAFAASQTTGGTPYQGYQQTAGYKNQLAEGVAAIDASAASSGGLYSGATLQSQNQFGQGLAAQGEGNYLNRLTALAGSGQNAAALQATNISNTANAVGGAYGAIGNAQAAAAIGQGNAFTGALNNLSGTFANAQAGGRGLGDRQTWLGF